MATTLYKARGVPAKRNVCAICVDRTRGRTELVDLGRGVTVWLCPAHAADDFRMRRNGRDFALTLQRLWSAHGCLTRTRSRALTDHLDALSGSDPAGRAHPGSYSWPTLRREAEARFAAGEPTTQVISDLRARHRHDYANVPSVRTMRRWYTDRRWLQLPPGEPENSDKGTGGDASPFPPAPAGPATPPADPTSHPDRATAGVDDRGEGVPIGRDSTGQVAITQPTIPSGAPAPLSPQARRSSSRPPPGAPPA